MTDLEILSRPEVRDALERHGAPLFVLDPPAALAQYTRLRQGLPDVTPHYAVKANNHQLLLRALVGVGANFDVATDAEIDAVLAAGGRPEQIIHTHPHKKLAHIEYALSRGVTTFVADSAVELQKLSDFDGVEVLARLSFRNPDAGSDLSAKFGIAVDESLAFFDRAMLLGVRIRGLSFHVGSQSPDSEPFERALRASLAVLDVLREDGSTLDTIDIGGGFPVAYREPVASLEDIAARLNPIIDARPDVRFISEPGRFIAAPAMTLISSVVSASYRPGSGAWAFIDDGVYGGYSNVLGDHIDPVLLTTSQREETPQTIAGPTCDSIDVIATSRMMPRLDVGDLIVSPNMGAYTTVTATDFNSIPRTRIIVLGDRAHGRHEQLHARQDHERQHLG